ALLERLWPQPRHVLQLVTAWERAVLVAMRDDVLRQALADARDAREQRRGGGVEIDADRVHAVFDRGVERARQLILVEIVLILADADRGRRHLHEFAERVLQAAGNGDRAADRDVE